MNHFSLKGDTSSKNLCLIPLQLYYNENMLKSNQLDNIKKLSSLTREKERESS